MKFQRLLQMIISTSVVLFFIGLNGVEAQSAEVTGSLRGHLIGRDTRQPLVGAFIVLCEIIGAYKCTLHSDLTATTDTDGWFTIKEVPVGKYTVAYAEAKKSGAVSLEDGFTLDVPYSIVEGSIFHKKRGLSFEFRKKRLIDFEVKAGETTEVEITAWGK